MIVVSSNLFASHEAADLIQAGQRLIIAILIKGIDFIDIALSQRKAAGILRLNDQHFSFFFQAL